MIIANTPKVKISGKPANSGISYDDETGVSTYKMRRMSVADSFEIVDIVRTGANAAGIDLRTLDIGTLDDPVSLVKNLGQLALEIAGEARLEVMRLMASLLGVKPELLFDPEYFPMGSEPAIFAAFRSHPDLKVLGENVGNALGGLKLLQTARTQVSPESSTPSSTDTDTPTTTS